MGPFEQQVENLCQESEKVVVQRTTAGYAIRGWNKAGKPILVNAKTPAGAETVKREIEAGKR